jgi:phosphate/phosphite/phosphonate ABC transporter binding protein
LKGFFKIGRRYTTLVVVVLLSMLVGSAGMMPRGLAAQGTFADPAFQNVWQRTDKLVADAKVARTWFWGPTAGKTMQEDYAESPGAKRLVQYFDKSRMEINNPAADKTGAFYVTNGLLTVELMSGKMRTGDNSTVEKWPADIPMTGDPNDVTAPSYASMAKVSNAGIDHRVADKTGQTIVETMSAVGVVSKDNSKSGKAKYTNYVPETGHNVADVFWTFLNQQGPVLSGGVQKTEQLIQPWFYASGYPISEAYWVKSTVGGKTQDVLLQAFERRTLTYNPTNPAGFQVEMGNIGQHYYDWRYKNAGRDALNIPAPNVTPITPAAGELGSADKPIQMAFIPSSNTQTILNNAQPLADQLSQITGYKFAVSVPTSYAAVIEAMGSEKADVAWFAPFAYVLANQKYNAQVILSTVRNNATTYTSIFITADPSVKTIQDLKGKKFAFVDPASASGYVFPLAYLKGLGIDPKTFFGDTTFAGGHDKVALAVYNGSVSGGVIFGGPPNPFTGAPTDARTLIKTTYPDVLDKVRIIGETQDIPNDTVSVRAGMTDAMKQQITNGLLVLAGTAQGKKVLSALYQIDGLLPVNDAFYDPVRKAAQDAGLTDVSSLFPTPTPKP